MCVLARTSIVGLDVTVWTVHWRNDRWTWVPEVTAAAVEAGWERNWKHRANQMYSHRQTTWFLTTSNVSDFQISLWLHVRFLCKFCAHLCRIENVYDDYNFNKAQHKRWTISSTKELTPMKQTKMGWFGVVRRHPRSFKIAPFDRAHTSSY